ncbi:AraC family transcriptional regulator [Pseudomonas abietaniphila]|uniref:AraC family transcriptional regulator n=1 Tax=Pseudomonas abietaniphila TaxID=89065 RepID=UPI003216A3CD
MSLRDTNIAARRAELVTSIERIAKGYGVFPTHIPQLNFVRSDTPTDTIHTIHKPGLCFIAQGRKEVRLWNQSYVYDPLNYLVVTLTLPLAGRVIEATPEHPYLCIRLDIDPAEIAQMVIEADLIGGPAGDVGRGLHLDQIDASVLDAILRLVKLLDNPCDIPALAQLAVKEIYYRLLQGRQGHLLREIAIGGSHTHRITHAIDWLNRNFAAPMNIRELARLAKLSSSTLHHRFKAITAMSPLQYQKQLRLHEARRLMISEQMDVTEARFKVGYESHSQFSRDYSRLFGTLPSRDIAMARCTA